ncbi:MAG TPA: GMC family oxidoreductase N-terminal domain-containing protein [Thermoleophilaceae bacterium]|jgi:choline dehydrogenase
MASYDYVVVGAGSAGCAVAARLSEDPGTSVLLLEAGPPDKAKEIRIPAAFSKLFKSKFDWGYETTPQPELDGRRIFFPRGKTLGGSSALNAQMYLPGHPEDFADWPEGWSWGEVKPYFERIDKGPGTVSVPRDPNPMTRAFLEAITKSGVAEHSDLGLEHVDGAGLVRVTQRKGLRCSAADAYLKPARGRQNLSVRTDAHVLGLELDGTRASGVRLDGETAEASREVILCAGAIGSPQLLMLSGIGPAEELRAHGIEATVDLPGVGRNLSDHPLAISLFDAKGKDSLYAAEKPIQLLRLLLRRRGLLTSNVGEGAAFLRTREELTAPDLELIFGPVLYVEEGLAPPPAHGFSIASIALQPRSRGSVRLRSADPLDSPDIDPAYLSDPEDLRVLVEGTKIAKRLAREGALEPWFESERAPADTDIEEWIRSNAHTIYHPVGTCAIGDVVDPELRVRGTEALRVVDASVLPHLNRGHTHAPATMVAERAAEMIRAAAPERAAIS